MRMMRIFHLAFTEKIRDDDLVHYWWSKWINFHLTKTWIKQRVECEKKPQKKLSWWGIMNKHSLLRVMEMDMWGHKSWASEPIDIRESSPNISSLWISDEKLLNWILIKINMHDSKGRRFSYFSFHSSFLILNLRSHRARRCSRSRFILRM